MKLFYDIACDYSFGSFMLCGILEGYSWFACSCESVSRPQVQAFMSYLKICKMNFKIKANLISISFVTIEFKHPTSPTLPTPHISRCEMPTT